MHALLLGCLEWTPQWYYMYTHTHGEGDSCNDGRDALRLPKLLDHGATSVGDAGRGLTMRLPVAHNFCEVLRRWGGREGLSCSSSDESCMHNLTGAKEVEVDCHG